MKFISPLTWPGGKSKQWKLIKEQLPDHINRFYDLFTGGGSVILNAYKDSVAKFYLMNDIDVELMNFWHFLDKDYSSFIEFYRVNNFDTLEHCREAYMNANPAQQYFMDNALTFGGYKQGSWSKQRLKLNFNDSKWGKLWYASSALHWIAICNRNYIDILENEYFRDDDLVFLDPPYFYNQKTKLYKHSKIDFNQLSIYLKRLNCKWLMTIDDSPEIRELFKDFIIVEKQWKYNSTNTKNKKTKLGKELFIRNYKLEGEE